MAVRCAESVIEGDRELLPLPPLGVGVAAATLAEVVVEEDAETHAVKAVVKDGGEDADTLNDGVAVVVTEISGLDVPVPDALTVPVGVALALLDTSPVCVFSGEPLAVAVAVGELLVDPDDGMLLVAVVQLVAVGLAGADVVADSSGVIDIVAVVHDDVDSLNVA